MVRILTSYTHLHSYVSLFTKLVMSHVGNHWISVCVNIIEKKVEAFDCQRGRNRQYVEKFAAMIPRIVKAVAPPESKKQLLLSPYSIVDVPMKSRLNKSCANCGVYALKHLECLLLGLDLSLVDDEIMQGCRQKIALDIWEATQDPMLIQLMAEHVPSDMRLLMSLTSKKTDYVCLFRFYQECCDNTLF